MTSNRSSAICRVIEGEKIVEYLYHYTSVDTLELILKNRTIRFNPLWKMDDPQEQYSAHGAAQGGHYFISSWTGATEEIPKMWQDYCKPNPDLGVRIKLPINPFSEKENNLFFPVPEQRIKLALNREKIMRAILTRYPETKCSMFEGFDGMLVFGDYKQKLLKDYPEVAKQLADASEQLMRETTKASVTDVNKLLQEVKYSDDPAKLFPHLYHEADGNLFGVFQYFGEYKNISWEWQQEWRYVLKFYNMTAFRLKADKTMEWYRVPFDYYDLILDADKIKQMEVTLSPTITEEGREKVEKIIQKYLPGTPINDSELSDT